MRTTRTLPSRTRRHFTLIELLVVVAIIAILASLLMPALQNARRSALDASCLSQLKQVGISYLQYSIDHDDVAPYTNSYPMMPGDLPNPKPYSITGLTVLDVLYTNSPRVYLCPLFYAGRLGVPVKNPNDDINRSRPYWSGYTTYGMDARYELDSNERRATWSRTYYKAEKLPAGMNHRWEVFPPTYVGQIKRPSRKLTVADSGKWYLDGTKLTWGNVTYLYPTKHAAEWGDYSSGPVVGRHGPGVTSLGVLNYPQRMTQMAFVDGRAAAAPYREVQQSEGSSAPYGHAWGKNDFTYYRNRDE